PRPSGPPRALPGWLALLRACPQGEVGRVLFPLARLHARACSHGVDIATRQLPVIGLAPHAEVHIAVCLIGVPLLDQSFDHLDNRRDLLRGPGEEVRRGDVQLSRRFVELFYVARGQLAHRLALGVRAHDQLVFDVGVVLHVLDSEAEELKIPAEHVEDDVAHRVAQMRAVVRSDAADVDLDLVAGRRELLQPPAHRVVKPHEPSPFADRRRFGRPSASCVPRSIVFLFLVSAVFFVPPPPPPRLAGGPSQAPGQTALVYPPLHNHTHHPTSPPARRTPTSEPAPIFAFSPIVTSPITLAPAPTTTLRSRVGCRLALRVLVPPRVTPWKRWTLSLMIAVSPMTTPIPWSMKNPSPMRAPGWISMPVKARPRCDTTRAGTRIPRPCNECASRWIWRA